MNLESYKKHYGFDSPEEKYDYVRMILDKNILLSFIKGDYRKLERYYRAELERY